MLLLLLLFTVYFSYRLSTVLKLFLYPEQVGVIISGSDSLLQSVLYNILPLVLLFISYIFSSKLIIRKYNLKPLEQEKKALDEELSSYLESTAGIEKIQEFMLHPSATPNSFAFGKSKQRAKIVLTKGLIENFNQHEIQSVILHEYGHIVNEDIGFVTWMESFIDILKYYLLILGGYQLYLIIRYLLNGSSFETVYSFTANSFYWFLINALVIGVIPYLLFNQISRSREYLADAYVCRMQGTHDLFEKTLLKITKYIVFSPYEFKGPSRLLIALPTSSEKTNRVLRYLSSKHPPLDQRISAMRGEAPKTHKNIELDIETMAWLGLISSLTTIILSEAIFDWVLASLNIVHFPEMGLPPIPLPTEVWLDLFGPWLYFIRYFIIVFPFVIVLVFVLVFYRELFLENKLALLQDVLVCFSISLSVLLVYGSISHGRLFSLHPRTASLMPDPFSEILSLNYLIPFFIVIVAGYSLLFRYVHLHAKN